MGRGRRWGEGRGGGERKVKVGRERRRWGEEGGKEGGGCDESMLDEKDVVYKIFTSFLSGETLLCTRMIVLIISSHHGD